MKNKKGFTLIELLAVIVILALLVAVAIPAVTKYLNTSRKGVFADNAAAAISAVRNQTIIEGFKPDTAGKNTKTYTVADVNKLLEKKLQKSPWGADYSGQVVVTASDSNEAGKTVTSYEYSIFLINKVILLKICNLIVPP